MKPFTYSVGEDFAEADLTYKGTPSRGMLAWLDNNQLKNWWKANSAIIEPAEGGMFYINWEPTSNDPEFAIYGIIHSIDAENHRFAINKVLCISPYGKLTNIFFEVSFHVLEGGYSSMKLVQKHNMTGENKRRYDTAVNDTWPRSLTMLKQFLEQ
jgi:hypothetical protein